MKQRMEPTRRTGRVLPADSLMEACDRNRPHQPPPAAAQAPARCGASLALAWLLLGVSALLPAAAFAGSAGDGKHDHGTKAALVEGLSGHHHQITTASPEAQQFFNQGLELAWAFNHHAARRAFQRAAELDPTCGMCFWGEALVLGPNINAVMEAEAVPQAWEALRKAQANKKHLTAREKAYIAALAERYRPEVLEDRSALDHAYASAMRRVANRFSEDLDAATLLAEALMDTTPWDYWTEENEPRAVTKEFLGVLESVLKREPGHPGANHLLIHAVEKVRPDLGIPSAERLEGLAEGAGHLVHMGGHIFIRVGRYHDAVRVNQKAIAADERFAAEHEVSDLYAFGYALHNIHFLAAAAGFLGNAEQAIGAAIELRQRVDPQVMRQPGMSTGQHFWVTPYFSWLRFGRWEEILAEPQPDDDLLYPTAAWHYARGSAFVRTGRLNEAARELSQLGALARDARLAEVTIWDLNDSQTLMRLAEQVLAGELAAARGEVEQAVEHLEQAVALEDGLTYDEPPPWMIPVRHNLGAVLLAAERAREAELVYREDLGKYPWNGWSLVGLRTALRAQEREQEANEVDRRLQEAWKHADVELLSSRF